MKVSTILDHIDSGHMALPEFQRGYVWNRDQVRGLFDSLYRRHPVGGLLNKFLSLPILILIRRESCPCCDSAMKVVRPSSNEHWKLPVAPSAVKARDRKSVV